MSGVRARGGKEREAMRVFGPLREGHPAVGLPCAVCGHALEVGDALTVIPLGPGDDPEAQAKAMQGRWYSCIGVMSHCACAGLPVKRGFCVRCQGGPANDWRYETLIEPDDQITLIPVPGREGEFTRLPKPLAGHEPWPGHEPWLDAVTYVRVRGVEQIDGECIYYPEGD